MLLGAEWFFTVWLLLCFVTFPVLLRLNFDKYTRLMFFAATAITSWQFVTSTVYENTNDIYGHLRYIHHVATTFSLPEPTGWQSHQPPLFYITAAIGKNIADKFGVEPALGARVVTSLFYYGFLISSALLLRHLISNKGIYLLCLALVLFWPAAARTSVKINNDVALAFFTTLSIYFSLKWSREKTTNLLMWALIFAGAAIISKGSGLIVIATIAFAILLLLYQKKLGFSFFIKKHFILGFLIILSGLAINFGRIYYWKQVDYPETGYLINRHDKLEESYDFVGNAPIDYLYFHFYDFIDKPYAELAKNTATAKFFWNVSLKTLIFDGYLFKNKTIGSLISFVFLLQIVLLFFLTRKYLALSSYKYEIGILLAAMFFAFFALMANRIYIPVSNSAQGRYVYFVVPLFISICGYFSEFHIANGIGIKRYLVLLPQLAMLALFIMLIVTEYS